MRRALVLSGGGMFGAWQAGAWRALAGRLRPDLVVGASVGALNGYAIACGASPDQLREFWLLEELEKLECLPEIVQKLMEHHRPRVDCGVVLTDLLRMKPRIFTDDQITWRHLAASCGIPFVLPHYKIDGRWYGDGGLLNPLPVWAAVELGATHIVALHALPEISSAVLRPFVRGFRYLAGHNPPLPGGIDLMTIRPRMWPLGSIRDALRWKRENIERWLAQGREDAESAFREKTFPF